MNPKHAIEIKDLYKAYGDIQAVQGVSLDIEAGRAFLACWGRMGRVSPPSFQ